MLELKHVAWTRSRIGAVPSMILPDSEVQGIGILGDEGKQSTRSCCLIRKVYGMLFPD